MSLGVSQSSDPVCSVKRAIVLSFLFHASLFLALFVANFLAPLRQATKIRFNTSGMSISTNSIVIGKKMEPLGVDRKLAPENITPPKPKKPKPKPTPAATPKTEKPKPLATPKAETKKPEPKAEKKTEAKPKPLPPAKTTRKTVSTNAKRALATPPPEPPDLKSTESDGKAEENTKPDKSSKDDGKKNESAELPDLADLPSLPNYDGPYVSSKGVADGSLLPNVGMQTMEGITLPVDYLYDTLRRIKPNFSYPSTVRLDKPMACVVQFRVYMDGRISDITVEQSTGDPVLDNYAKQALERTMSLRPLAGLLPKDFDQDYITAGMPFSFGDMVQ